MTQEHVHWTFTSENGYRSLRRFPTEQEARDGAELIGSSEPVIYAVPAPQCLHGCVLDAIDGSGDRAWV